MKAIDMSQVQEVTVKAVTVLNRRVRLRSMQGQGEHAWVDFGAVTFMEAAKQYCQTFAASLEASGDIEPGKPFFVQVAEDDANWYPVPSCIFQMQKRVEFDVINPRLGSD